MQKNDKSSSLKIAFIYKSAIYAKIKLIGGKIVLFISYSCVRIFYERICFTYRWC